MGGTWPSETVMILTLSEIKQFSFDIIGHYSLSAIKSGILFMVFS